MDVLNAVSVTSSTLFSSILTVPVRKSRTKLLSAMSWMGLLPVIPAMRVLRSKMTLACSMMLAQDTLET